TELVSHQQRFRRSGLRIIRAFFCDASPSCKKKLFFFRLMKKHTELNINRSKLTPSPSRLTKQLGYQMLKIV
ncbi:hypothetical protein, partial [Vibrio variabilis]|uniref:hypothetical protein n=1 Tax=Vibrio variabilis TaxID=990271 RepID=UPI001E3DE3EF